MDKSNKFDKIREEEIGGIKALGFYNLFYVIQRK